MFKEISCTLALAVGALGCDPVWEAEVEVVVSPEVAKRVTTPSQVVLSAGEPGLPADRIFSLFVLCANQDMDVVVRHRDGGVCGSATEYRAYLLPLVLDQNGDAESVEQACGEQPDRTYLDTTELTLPEGTPTAQAVAFPDATDKCADSGSIAKLSLKLE